MRDSLRTALSPVFAALAALALGLAGCGVGGGGGPASDDPARIAPADAALYANASVRPEGDQKDAAEAFLSKVLDSDDPGARIQKLIDQGFKDAGEDKTFAKDVEPWLGKNAAVFVTGYENDPPAVVAVSSDDPDAGIRLLESESVKTTDKEFQDVAYKIDEEGNAFGAIEGFVVFGDEPALKAAASASKGDSLADSDDYSDAVDEVDDDAIATAYVNTEGIAHQVAVEEDVPEDAVKRFFGGLGEGRAAAGVQVSDDRLTADITAPASGEGAEREASTLLETLPSDAFAAIGLNDTNKAIERLVDQLESAGIPNLGEGDIAKQLQERFDIDLRSDILSWVGDGALFLSGTSVEDLGGALVLETRDPTASAGLIAKLATLIQRDQTAKVEPLDLPGAGEGYDITDPSGQLANPIHVVQRDDRIVIGYQDALTEEAFHSDETLSSNELFSTARDAVGSDHPLNLYLAFGPILALIDSSPAGDDPGYVAAKKYLDALDFLGSGTQTSDDRTDTRVVVGVK